MSLSDADRAEVQRLARAAVAEELAQLGVRQIPPLVGQPIVHNFADTIRTPAGTLAYLEFWHRRNHVGTMPDAD